ncbi:hypothetical protein, partial [Candidatus Frankia alpina]|uniref:hypothetical protein n=1 Tax=Candidatus Frankia alpina TaxID=2699483 RepID=UPI001967D2DB
TNTTLMSRKATKRYRERLSLYTLAAANALITALRSEGSAAAATQLAKQTVELLRTSLPQDHPFIFYCMENLANCYYDTNSFILAQGLDQEVEAGLRTKLGDSHPLTMIASLNHATSLARTDPATLEFFRNPRWLIRIRSPGS